MVRESLVAAGDPKIVWLGDPLILAPLAVLVAVYVMRFRLARREAGGRGAGPAQAIAFTGAIVALLIALVSPVEGLGDDYLFSAHMVQHLLIGDIAPLLLLLSLSRVIMRPATRRLMSLERRLGPFASPVTGIAIWIVLMYVWHLPALYDAALRHPVVHLVEHAAFFTAGVAVWWPLIQPVPMRRRLTGMWPLAYIGTAKFGLAVLGLFLTWSGTAIYGFYDHVPRIWGLSQVDDQNVGGAIMMVEQSFTFVTVLTWAFMRMLGASEADAQRQERLEGAGR